MSDLRNRPGVTLSSIEHSHVTKIPTPVLRENTMDEGETNEFIVTGLDSKNTENMGLKKNNDDANDVPNSIASSYNHEIKILARTFNYNTIVVVMHFNIFLYSSSFWIQNAVFPYVSKQLGADPVMFGYLQTVFAFVQLAGGPLFGRFGDLFGARNAMVLAFAAAALTYLFLYFSTSIPILFLSRLPSVFMHSMQGGQMIITDVCDSKERATALARLGLSYGVGMVIGPIMGGLISKHLGLEIGSLVAFFLSVLSMALMYIYIPGTLKRNKSDGESIFSFKKIVELLKAPGAAFLMGLKLGTGIPMGIFQSMFSIIALEIFKLPPDQNSYIMSYVGIMAMLVQGFAVGPISRRFSEIMILTGSAALLCIAYLMLSFVTSIAEVCVVFIPLITGLTLQNVLTTSALTHTVTPSDTGAMLGLNMAVNSLIRTVSPTIGGYMLGSIGFFSFGYLGFVTSAIATLVLIVKMRN